jgi:hypothetical protein
MTLEKGKPAQIGEVHNWASGPHKKTAQGWVEVTEPGQIAQQARTLEGRVQKQITGGSRADLYRRKPKLPPEARTYKTTRNAYIPVVEGGARRLTLQKQDVVVDGNGNIQGSKEKMDDFCEPVMAVKEILEKNNIDPDSMSADYIKSKIGLYKMTMTGLAPYRLMTGIKRGTLTKESRQPIYETVYVDKLGAVQYAKNPKLVGKKVNPDTYYNAKQFATERAYRVSAMNRGKTFKLFTPTIWKQITAHVFNRIGWDYDVLNEAK